MLSRKFMLLASSALLISASSALAADLRSKKPMPPVAPVAYAPPVFSWTGAYVGLNAGFTIRHGNNGTLNVQNATPVTYTDYTSYGSPRDVNFTGGAQIGYNWQFNRNFVVGLETDINYKTRSNNYFSGSVPSNVTGDNIVGLQSPRDVNWFGTIRARLGYAMDRVLLYVTGGFAYGGGTKGAQAIYYSGSSSSPSTTYGASNKTLMGWTLGAGVEYAFTQNWIGRLEYLYVNLGNKTQTLWPTSALQGSNPPTSMTIKTSNNFSVLRAGVSYKF